MATYKRIAKLIVKHRKNTLNKQEKEELEKWRNLNEDNQLLFNRLNDTGYVSEKLDELYSVDINEEWGRIRHMFPRKKTTALTAALKYAAMVIGLLLTVTITYYLIKKHNESLQLAANGQNSNGPVPDAYRVELKLGNGKTVYLDSSIGGHIALQYRSVIYKQGNLLRYEWSTGDAAPQVEYNTLSTPRTRTFAVELPDGSKAWLNAASSITYPTAFTGKERVVSITGEVYFEVNPRPDRLDDAARKLFVVVVNAPPGKGKGARIEVLGTHFNINAYQERPAITTTLLQGKVKVVNNARADDTGKEQKIKQQQGGTSEKDEIAYLVPGQQAQVRNDGSLNVIKYADLEETMGWYKEALVFHDADIKVVLQEVARQFDYDIVYREPVNGHYTLSVSKTEGVSAVLDAIQLAGAGEVHFKIKGKKIIVSQ